MPLIMYSAGKLGLSVVTKNIEGYLCDLEKL